MERVRGQWFWWALAAVLIVVAAVHVLGGGAGSGAGAPVQVAAGSPPPHEPPVAGPNPASRAGAKLYVHVAGRVRKPGLYRLTPGARVASAIDLAGGAAQRADLTKVNLAARLEDGQQILVPRVGAAATAVAGDASAAGTTGAKVSLAGATAEQLDGLDGIGPTLAKRIVQYRDAHGGFRSVGQLRDVEGIGAKRFETLRKGVGP
jgi:competence protein ComEA